MTDARLDPTPFHLASPDGGPFRFEARVEPGAPGGGPPRLAVTGPDPRTGAPLARSFVLSGRDQDAYLDLHEGLAGAFGTRLPRNREEAPPADVAAPLRTVLDRPLSPDILYGYGDPAVIRVEDDLHYLVATSNDAPNAFPILRSRGLEAWEPAGFVFPEGRTPAWTATGLGIGDFWAPEMHRVGGRFLVCFTARERNGGLAIGLAESASPEGPFAADDAPLVTGGVIDAHLLVEGSGRVILYWKEDANDVWPGLLAAFLRDRPGHVRALLPEDRDRRTACLALTLQPWLASLEPMERFQALQPLIESVVADFAGFRHRLAGLAAGAPGDRAAIDAIRAALRTPVFAQELDVENRRLVGERRVVLENDRPWEAHLIEGIWVHEHRGRYFMFYAGNDFSTPEYGTGVAVAGSPFGPFAKREEPLLRSTRDWAGPGHPSVALGSDGRPRLFLHAFFPGQAGYKRFRAVLAATLSFDGDEVTLG